MKTTLITVVHGNIDSDILNHLNAISLAYNVFLTSKKLDNVQNYLYGNCGFSMFDVICSKLDKLTVETLNQ